MSFLGELIVRAGGAGIRKRRFKNGCNMPPLNAKSGAFHPFYFYNQQRRYFLACLPVFEILNDDSCVLFSPIHVQTPRGKRKSFLVGCIAFATDASTQAARWDEA